MSLTRSTNLRPETLRFTPGKLLVATLIIIPVLIYLIYGFRYSASIFFGDDYDLLETITLAPEAKTVSEKIHFWFKQQNEHRVLFPRFITFLDYQFEGFINWRSLILIANLIWVGILYFLWRAFRSLNLPAWLFIPVSWILFQPQYYDNLTWATSILQQSNVVFWLSFTVFLYAKGQHRAALIPAVIAAFSHGSGLSSFLVVFFLIVLEQRWRLLRYWIPAAALTFLIYFYRLEKGQSANFAASTENPVQLIKSFFAFFGSITRVLIDNPHWAVAAGFLMLLIIVAYLIPVGLKTFRPSGTQFKFFDLMLIGNSVFLAISASLVSISRSWAGLESVMPPRYQHYTVFLVCWVYLVLLKSAASPRLRSATGIIFVAGALLFNLLSYLVYHPLVVYRRDFQLADETNYLNHTKFLQYHWTFNRNISNVYQKSLEKGVTKMSRRFPEIAGKSYPHDSTRIFRYSVRSEKKTGENPPEHNRIFRVEGESNDLVSTFLYFEPEDLNGYWIPVQNARPAFKDFFLRGVTQGKSFFSEFYYDNLPEGRYKIGYLKNDVFSWTNQRLEVLQDSLTMF